MLIFQSKSNFIRINSNESNIAVSESLSPWNVSEKKGWQNMAQNLSQYSFWFGIKIPFSALSQFNSNWNRHQNFERNRIQHKEFRRIQPQKLESNNKLNYSALSSCVHAQEHRRRCHGIVHTPNWANAVFSHKREYEKICIWFLSLFQNAVNQKMIFRSMKTRAPNNQWDLLFIDYNFSALKVYVLWFD